MEEAEQNREVCGNKRRGRKEEDRLEDGIEGEQREWKSRKLVDGKVVVIMEGLRQGFRGRRQESGSSGEEKGHKTNRYHITGKW